jgi:hypothetical protein
MEIQQTDNGKKGAFFITINDVKMAEMTYLYAGEDKINIDHTEVNETLKGQGVGNKLIDAAVAYFRANHLKVIPLCPFANAVFKKKQDVYADVLI